MITLTRLLACWLILLGAANARAEAPAETQVNILIVTVDDMNWNSVGAFGAPIRDITPHIDALAQQGRRFERAYVTASNCSPSRVALQTGRYPQQTGATGFFYVDDSGLPTIATELRRRGYLTGVINKVEDTNPGPDRQRYWDFARNLGKADKYAPQQMGQTTAAFLARARAERRPFYLTVNIADPHKPNFNDPEATTSGADAHAPSRIIAASEVTVPGFLPDVPEIRADLRNYLNSVKRADDAVGAIIAALEASGMAQDTLVVFLSDHGMPFPFAKSSVYDNSLRTPLIMRWPGRIAPGSLETGLVSTVDLLPTILDATGTALPAGTPFPGRALLASEPSPAPDYVFGSFDENARGYPVPMRAAIGQEWIYVFNAWSDGAYTIKNDDMNHATFKQMVRHAPHDPAIRARLSFYLAPPVEELCHLTVDPDCLINRAEDPTLAPRLADLRAAMRAQMLRTGDPLIAAFDSRADRTALRRFMDGETAAAQARADILQWKRPDNIAGPTRANRGLFRKPHSSSAAP